VRAAAKRLRDERGRSAESNFDQALAELGHRHQTWRLFSDFVEMAALSVAQAVIHTPEREERFERLRTTYNAEEYDLMARMLGYVVEGLEEGLTDFLGSAFMRNELGNHWQGQFFTPFCVSQLMARMLVDDRMRELVDARGYVTVHEPAAGSGGMVLALAEAISPW
jgi:type I restriction-modification system DNA methylase subunit